MSTIPHNTRASLLEHINIHKFQIYYIILFQIFNFIFIMAKTSESDYRLLPSYILSNRSVLNPINQDLKSFGHAIVFAHHQTDWNARRGQPAKEERFI